MRYQALLTVRQTEILTFLDDRSRTVPQLWEDFESVNWEWDLPVPARESIYVSLRWLEARGLVIRDDSYWPHLWTATDAGGRALDDAEKGTLMVRRVA